MKYTIHNNNDNTVKTTFVCTVVRGPKLHQPSSRLSLGTAATNVGQTDYRQGRDNLYSVFNNSIKILYNVVKYLVRI